MRVHAQLSPAPAVTVVVPAHDAAATLGETLDALRVQTWTDWEAVVVDDGSRDATALVARIAAARDPRVRVLARPRGGVGAARNAGAAAARGRWLLFLDADDWIAPDALERLLAAERADVDVVVGRWERVLGDGTRLPEPPVPDPDRLFPTLARYCPFAIHACLVRRQVVQALGGFPEQQPSTEDWDLWQRVARAGARFATVDAVVASYRARPHSAAMDVHRMLRAGGRLIALGHAPDPRVEVPDPRWAHGMPAGELGPALFRFVGWPAGLLVGAGQDPRQVLEVVAGHHDPTLEPWEVAAPVFRAALLPSSRPPTMWTTDGARLWALVDPFLDALEVASGRHGLAVGTRAALEALVVAHAPRRPG
jgi:SAM-dependent methyltransferase